MKFTEKRTVENRMVLANDHYVAVPYDCTDLTALATEGVLAAGLVVPANDATAIGVLLNDVDLAENPNGALVVHGFINGDKLPVAPSAEAVVALAGKGVYLLNRNGVPLNQKFTVVYDANGGSGTVTDSNSPYLYGAEVTVLGGTGLTGPDSKTFAGWALTPEAVEKVYEENDKFQIEQNMTLYAVWA